MSRRLSPKRAGEAPIMGLRLPADLSRALDAARRVIAEEHPDLAVTRSDAVRVLVREALAARGLL